MTASATPVYTAVEVSPPPPRRGRWTALYEAIDDLPMCEEGNEEVWHRFTLEDSDASNLAQISVTQAAPKRGYKVKTRRLREEPYLWILKVPLDE